MMPSHRETKMSLIKRHVAANPLAILLLAFPFAIFSKLGGWGAVWVFIFSAVGIIPLAGYIGDATEILAVHTGPRIGGLLNATLGNAAELIITLFAIRAGLLDLVKASLTGSIIGNLLLVLGFSILAGGLKHGIQTFDRRQSSNQVVLLTMAVLAMAVPSLFNQFAGSNGSVRTEYLSLGVAVIMIVLYGVGLFYSLQSSKSSVTYQVPKRLEPEGNWPAGIAILVLAISTGGVIWLSELLVGAVQTVVISVGLSEFFLGIILIPIIGNVAEHIVAMRMAMKNKMELSVEIAVSSSLQIALFVAPLLVFLSPLMGHPLSLIFNPFELIALGAAVLVTILVASDGESNWLEGVALLGVYLILGLAFFFLPM
jgi:Ca2+:H+ antiporter